MNRMRAVKGNCGIDLGRVSENFHFLRGIACLPAEMFFGSEPHEPDVPPTSPDC